MISNVNNLQDAGGPRKALYEALRNPYWTAKGGEVFDVCNLRQLTKSASCVYLIGREPVMRMSTSLLALCCQSGPDATWETPIRARSRSNGSRSLRMSPLLIARFTNESIAPWI
jgi:hypothetical protein